MLKQIIYLIIIISFVVIKIELNICAENNYNEIKVIEKEIKLEELLQKIKEGQNINIYYREETIIKESQREEYLEHLANELKTSLKKGKKYGKIRRIEDNLVEIDKGAIHKVRERDVYRVYDSSERCKGVVEVGAIADAVSIGEIYSVKNKLLSGDKIKYIGQRRYYKLGIEGGAELFNDNSDLTFMEPIYSGFGPKFEYIIKGGYGFCILLSYYSKKIGFSDNYIGDLHDILDEKIDYIYAPFGVNKYFNYPGFYSPFLGLGVGYKYSELKYSEQTRNDTGELIKDINLRGIKKGIIPYVQIGLQFSSLAIIVEIGMRCYYEPRQEFMNTKYKRVYRAEILYIPNLSLSMGW